MYYISNIDHEIHNTYDVSHRLINHDTWVEISILDTDGGEIDSCVAYTTIDELVKRINESSNPKEIRWTVHKKHCTKSTCKYGDTNCPIVKGLISPLKDDNMINDEHPY